MIKFLFAHITKNPIRSLSIIGSISILFLTIIGSVYLYKNSTSAIEYYARHGNNEKRVTITSTSSVLNIFQSESGMKEKTIQQIQNDPLLENVQVFRLVSIPVSAKFDVFSFSLETDIPVFSVTDSSLSGAEIPVGMSRTMLDLYNTQFAGSSQFFPQMNENFIRGQKVHFTFGKSKIFQSGNNFATPITGTITTISNDFPGLGLTLPESIVKEKMAEIGYQPGAPYKIVAYIKDLKDKERIEKTYSNGITTRFEIDEIYETRNRIALIGKIIFGVGSGIVSMFMIFFLFLLGSYFRERKDIFKMIGIFGLKSIKSYILTIGEPIILVIIGIINGILLHILFSVFLEPKIEQIIHGHGFLFPIHTLHNTEVCQFATLTLICIVIIIVILEWKNRGKYRLK